MNPTAQYEGAADSPHPTESGDYDIRAESFQEAMNKVVNRFRVANPSIGKAKLWFHDGTTVVVVIRNKTPKGKK